MKRQLPADLPSTGCSVERLLGLIVCPNLTSKALKISSERYIQCFRPLANRSF